MTRNVSLADLSPRAQEQVARKILGGNELSYRLPLPPSLNNAYVNIPGRGRRKSAEYKAWRHLAGQEILAQGRRKIAGRVEVDISLPTTMRGDADNRIKPLLDLLVAMDVIDDDRHVWELRVSRHASMAGRCAIAIRPATPAQGRVG